ncbi:hypothetical protein HCJ76_44035 [Streptomyces sp. MC1]|uniref:hypothetical protein n=1 Tax=Streptomyces sp. MC1 TaxID=295105 RepID=UPI0018CB574A|nr:hypothetical protein [Streptomyces sp. MC1]MBG7704854.1 hypothetical protein [Streptomyces sp. MC1]
MSSHYGKKRGKKPQHRAREARRAAFDVYLPRLLRGDLTPAEAALLAEYIREEMRVSDETHNNLRATSRALDSIRNATDDAVREAEQRAKEAEARAATLESHPAHAQENEADSPAVVLHTVARPAPVPGADEMRRQALANALDVAPGTPWPTLLQHAHEAHQWARRARSSAEEAGRLKDEMARNTVARESLGRRLVEAQEQAREATAAALRLRSQTPGAALRTLDSIRSASGIGEVCTHLGMFYGMSPETAGQMARRWRTTAERSAEERARKAEAAHAQLHRDTTRAAAQDRATLAQWEATYGKRALRDTQARLRTYKDAMARLRALRADSGSLAESSVGPNWMASRWGPTWQELWEVLGDAVNDPILTTAAARCEPGAASEGHPVHALLKALNEDKRPEEAQRLVRDFYDAIHGACCPLDHRDPRPGRAAEMARRLLDNQIRQQIRQASLFPVVGGR